MYALICTITSTSEEYEPIISRDILAVSQNVEALMNQVPNADWGNVHLPANIGQTVTSSFIFVDDLVTTFLIIPVEEL